MFIKKLDLLSPPITLFFKEEGQHSSIFSGILSFIAYVLVSIAGVYYFLDFIHKTSPKAYFFNRYINDAGTFPVNATAMFNFIQIIDSNSNQAVPFDYSIFRAIGLDDAYYEDYMNNPEIISNIDHWIYGNCNNNTDTEGIGYLIDFDYFEQSACIRRYYDKEKKKYFNTGEKGFRWPIVEKGCSNPDRTYFGIILQRCDKIPDFLKEQGQECKSEDDIVQHINKVSLKFHLIDHYADMLNYEMPFTKYFYDLTSAITDRVFIINHLNFNPANMITHKGIVFDSTYEERSYFFVQNEKHTVDHTNLAQNKTTNGCLIGIYFWMQNSLQFYERNYDKFQDVLSDIGGISSIVVTIAYLINLLVNNYIILIDIESLVLNTDQHNFNRKEDLKNKPTILQRARDILNPPRKSINVNPSRNVYIEESQEPSSSNYQKLAKDSTEIYRKSKEEKEDQYTSIFAKRSQILKNINSHQKRRSNIIQKSKLFTRNMYPFTKRIIYSKQNTRIEPNTMIPRIYKKEDSQNEIENENENNHIHKQDFTWFRYILYLIYCQKNDQKINYYETFRAKLISEENIIQNYLDIYKLLKVNNIPKKGLI